MTRMPKKQRQVILREKLRDGMFLTDEELAATLGVSVQTIRLDRLELGIPELRERTRQLAHENHAKIRTMTSGEIVGELIDLELGHAAISLMTITPEMVFEKTKIARGHYLFAQANSLALGLIDAPTAVTGVANVKYKTPVYMGAKLVAKAEVVKIRGNKYFVWVKTRNESREVFRAKFILVSLDQ